MLTIDVPSFVFSFDFKMRIFYFCDVQPASNLLQCYSHHTDTNKVASHVISLDSMNYNSIKHK